MELHYIKKLYFYYIRQIRALGQNGLLLANNVPILVNVGFGEYNRADLSEIWNQALIRQIYSHVTRPNRATGWNPLD
jgi:hypothetical protein